MSGKVEKNCPIGWRTDIEIDEVSVDVTFRYWAHNRPDEDRRRPAIELKKEYHFKKQDALEMIPEKVCLNPNLIVNYERFIDDKLGEVVDTIKEYLINDFEDMPSKDRTVSNMYSGLLSRFTEYEEYEELLNKMIKYEVILKLLARPKCFQGEDIRKFM